MVDRSIPRCQAAFHRLRRACAHAICFLTCRCYSSLFSGTAVFVNPQEFSRIQGSFSSLPPTLDDFSSVPRIHDIFSTRKFRNSARKSYQNDNDEAHVEFDKSAHELATTGSSAVLSQKPCATNASHLQMLSFYCFQPVSDPWRSRNDFFSAIHLIPGLRGTVYIAKEGINAQMAVPPGNPLDQLLEACSKALPFDPFHDNRPNWGDLVPIETPTFSRLVVRVRDYVLRDGITTSDGNITELDWSNAGNELSPARWHQELSTKDSTPLVLDCRNLYETQQGTFYGAIPLETANFQESWSVLNDMTRDLPRDKPLHIFCTGGIRCVKVGAYLKQELGFQNVNRLQHGIIGYQQWIQEEEGDQDAANLWKGNNFLFDKRRLAESEMYLHDLSDDGKST